MQLVFYSKSQSTSDWNDPSRFYFRKTVLELRLFSSIFILREMSVQHHSATTHEIELVEKNNVHWSFIDKDYPGSDFILNVFLLDLTD